MNSSHGSLENIILNAIWSMEESNQGEVSVLDVQDKVNSNKNKTNQQWAYTTIKTVLDRLTEKNIIKKNKKGKKFFYQSVYSRERMGYMSIEKVAKQYYNGDFELMLKAVEKVCNEAMAFV